MIVSILKSKTNWKSKSGLFDEFMNEGTNLIVDTITKDLNEKFKNKKGKIHKESSTGEINISIDENNNTLITKSNFCCDFFKDSIDVD